MKTDLIIIAIVCIIIMISGTAFLIQKKEYTEYTPMTKEKYKALQWLKENSAKNTKILCLEGFYEWNCMFSERPGFEADSAWLRTEWRAEEPLRIKGNWMGHSLNLPKKKKGQFFYEAGRNITRTNYLEDEVNAADFDIIIMQNSTNTNVNQKITEAIKKQKNTEIIYDKNNIQIIKISE